MEEKNDEVIIPTISFVATANAISHLGATPHFVDIDKNIVELGKKLFPNVNFLYGDADNIPFDNNYFDFIICFNSSWLIGYWHYFF